MQLRSLLSATALLLCSLLLSHTASSDELDERLRLAAENYEQVITAQLAEPGQRSFQDWLVLAQAYLSANNKDSALQALNQAGELANTDLQHSHVALLTAKVYGILFRDTRHALSYLQQADELLRDSRGMAEQQLYSEVLTNFAQAHNQLGDLTQAGHFASASLQLAIDLNDPVKELAARIMLGRLALQNNHFQRAYTQLQQALLLADSQNDQDARASIHFRLGMAFRKIDEHSLALEHMQQAAGLYQQLKNLSSYSYVLVYMAETYLEQPQDIALAEQHLLQALTISQQVGDVMRTAIVKQSLGRASRIRNDHEQAARYYSEALQQFRQIGAQTYVQETALALAELAVRQQQFDQAQHIINEISPLIDDSANYLQARFFSLSAELAAEQQSWQQAYQLNLQASQLQFAELTAKTADKLHIFKDHLNQSNAQQDNHLKLLAQQQNMTSQLRHWQQFAAILGLLTLAAVGYCVWQQKRHRHSQTLRMAFLLSQRWSRFCERVQQECRSKKQMHLIAMALTNSQQLKLEQGEEALRQPLQGLLDNLASAQLTACCINSDVLWLGFQGSADEATAFSQHVLQTIQRVLGSEQAANKLVSLQLDINQMLGPRWQTENLTALREAFWLCWQLATVADDNAPQWQMTLTSTQPRPCEWHSRNVRLDMTNALQLGTLTLTLNQQLLAANLSNALSSDVSQD
tara:strand:+ start:2049 stop:4130 length:2082 start_codon:yes stop_codon:yes gene_type:complete